MKLPIDVTTEAYKPQAGDRFFGMVVRRGEEPEQFEFLLLDQVWYSEYGLSENSPPGQAGYPTIKTYRGVSRAFNKIIFQKQDELIEEIEHLFVADSYKNGERKREVSRMMKQIKDAIKQNHPPAVDYGTRRSWVLRRLGMEYIADRLKELRRQMEDALGFKR